MAHLAAQVAAGNYSVPSIDVAHAILFGRPKWGEDPVSALNPVGEGVGVLDARTY